MRLEAMKTQHLCSKCHIEITISREGGARRPSSAECKKREYIRKLKQDGCSSCGFVDDTCERFFEFDHIDPSTKVDKIASMVMYDKYTQEELIEELDKCRLLCAFCHTVHTKRQISQGIINYVPNKNKK